MKKMKIRLLSLSILFLSSSIAGSESPSWLWGNLKKLFCRSHNAYQAPIEQQDDHDEYRCVVRQDCTMCLEALFKGNSPVSLLSCAHMYHQTCIGNWTQGCPACREPIDQSSIALCRNVEEVVSGLQEKIFTKNSELARSTRRVAELRIQLGRSNARLEHLESQRKIIRIAGIVSVSLVVAGSLTLLCRTMHKR